jgi:hypothetical protein
MINLVREAGSNLAQVVAISRAEIKNHLRRTPLGRRVIKGEFLSNGKIGLEPLHAVPDLENCLFLCLEERIGTRGKFLLRHSLIPLLAF